MRTKGATSLIQVKLKELVARYGSDDEITVGRIFFAGRKTPVAKKAKEVKAEQPVEQAQPVPPLPKVQVSREW